MLFLLPHALDRAAERFPDHEAVRCYSRSLTYADLVYKANGLAHLLIQQGVKRGDRVGVYLHKSLESAVAIWGIMKAGAAYVPLDPMAPPTRLATIAQNCGIRHIITQDGMQPALLRIMGAGAELACLLGIQSADDLPVCSIGWTEIYSAATGSAPHVRVIEQDLAYIMYTSGSTGDPKGIMHTHHSGLSYAQWAAHEYGLHHGDRIANHAPLHFDISTYDWFAGALAASAVVIVPEEHTKLPASYAKLLADEKISVLFTVPFALVQLLLRGALSAQDLSSLRWVIFGGEPFPSKHLGALMGQLPHARFSNIYGPAEVNGVTFYHVPAPPGDDEPVPIGQPCPFAQALVVDEDDRPVADGEGGELLIRSPTMMQGYWGRPDLNERAFYRRRIVSHYEEIFYRTGDLVRRQVDGAYLFLGRKDRQIKTRGFRVELDEIEATLLLHPDVEVAAVFTLPDGTGNNEIQAAVIVRNAAHLTASALSRYLSERLPWYAVPAKIRFMTDFPRTASDKINRRELQAHALNLHGSELQL
jgi:amino acid adenylation domain-containing protein